MEKRRSEANLVALEQHAWILPAHGGGHVTYVHLGKVFASNFELTVKLHSNLL